MQCRVSLDEATKRGGENIAVITEQWFANESAHFRRSCVLSIRRSGDDWCLVTAGRVLHVPDDTSVLAESLKATRKSCPIEERAVLEEGVDVVRVQVVGGIVEVEEVVAQVERGIVQVEDVYAQV